ncbi:IS110 family transposase [Vibrio sp. JC009]|uniref:IS110 family transposase n=1 Tax=Vibrio sp. JC009 TaxID=2912314 RepID=UPI0023AF0520|nr:IS110 family transposase [Vibrio sp. JC009]WED20558.1 IS110 family transposase [Vibrio sp. JC009]WED20573.1 IS110 family transposase [Vibrio sp. JC009]WED20575.1 IS110 family transposase [Vibrio sp. JC009]WED20658.1 IS110 family transposase [Vibrio sp. JC009]WED21017.1 IS110 family transposase [Vibrio sp. JC009]
MKYSTVIAIDLAKSVFQVCKMNFDGKIIFNREMSRKKLLEFLAREKATLVAMESCSTTNYWARYAKEQGHEVKAIAPRRAAAFRQGQKTDANDAIAIAIAATQSQIKSCRIPTVEEQCQQSIVHMRDLLVRQKVSISNQLRSYLLEFGIPITKGDKALREAIPYVLEDADNGLTGQFRACLSQMYEQFINLIEQVEAFTQQLQQSIAQDKVCRRLQALEGVGPVCSVLLKVALGQAEHFSKGREASACLGLTPVQHSSGGKQKIGSIAKKCGHNMLRSALFRGALTVVCKLEKREARTGKEQWLKDLTTRRGKKVAAIALANKTVRTALAMIKSDEEYKPQPLVA